ncbi:MAG: 30S ribosome-binding factor RbfA [Clostridiales bacterium]|nr:30S ribosome-binding factor RbfA [Clostridiales bacterium]
MNNRTDKLNSEFKRYIAEILTKRVKDPRITEMYTVLAVDCDRELSQAKVYVSIYSTDAERAAQTFLAIRENEPFIRREISKNMHIRKVPEFNFILDTSMAYGQKINEILYDIKKSDNDD